jgi:hypothetical protein
MAMTAVVAMSAAHGVSARLQVAHWNFLRLIFAHITFLRNVWVVSVLPNIFSLRRTHGEDMITPRAKKFCGKVLTLWLCSIRNVSL